MPNRSRRATADRRIARHRARAVADRYGRTLRECRTALRLTQSQASDRAGVSQPFWSSLERGGGITASLETLSACAAAVDAQLAAFIEARPGADLPRDIEHLRRQELIVRIAGHGGWRGRPEHPLESNGRQLSVDVQLERATPMHREVAVIEIEDWLGDVGAAWRNLGTKVAAIRQSEPESPTGVAGLLVVRATQRNRRLVRELGALFDARFPAAPGEWLRALTRADEPMPDADGWLWSAVDGRRLIAPRRAAPRSRTRAQHERRPSREAADRSHLGPSSRARAGRRP